MNNRSLFSANNGLVVLEPEAVKIFDLLEKHFLSWAAQSQARPLILPPVIAAKDLSTYDYFLNFPHLGVALSGLQADKLAASAKTGGVQTIASDDLKPSEYLLPSSACYNVYIYLTDQVLETPAYITTVARCFRNEDYYDNLKRLWGFTMREIVCVGTMEAVQAHVETSKQQLIDFAAKIGLPLKIDVATDPFFDKRNPRAVMQKLFPVKQEFLYGDGLAIASVNFHRNFFGERRNIRTTDEAFAYSGCVGYGLERWLHALLDHFNNDVEAIYQALAID